MKKSTVCAHVVALLLVVTGGCGAYQMKRNTAVCGERFPKDIKGLVVKGDRPRQNIIENMTIIECNWRSQCERDNKKELSGTINLTLTVNRMGEVGVVTYSHNVKDSGYVRMLVEGLPMLDFDPWNEGGYETVFECPVRLVD